MLSILIFVINYAIYGASQVALVVKKPGANAGDVRDGGLILGSGIAPEGGHGSPLQYSCPQTEDPGRL